MNKFNFLALLALLFLSACSSSNSDEPDLRIPSYRDKVYEGSLLTVYLDGIELDFVKSAEITSNQIGHKDDNLSDFNWGDPIYDATIIVDGFPNKKTKTTIQHAILNNRDFSGEVTTLGTSYQVFGEFTGNPLYEDSQKGCIIYFTKK